MKLTDHFTLPEFTLSQTAERQGIDNTPTDAVIVNLCRLASVMEEIRSLLDVPIIITSGYRSPLVNRAVGGAYNSAHLEGLAADFIAPVFGSPFDVCEAIEPHLAALTIDQLIHEHTWVHVGLRAGAPRHQVLTLLPGQGYTQGIVRR